MGRVPRWRMGRGVYHVFNRGLNDAWILNGSEDREFFVDLLCRLRNGFRMNVYHYVIMSNHFHLSIEVLDSRELSSYVGGVCSMYSRYWHRKNGGGHGPIWQGRFKSVVVQTEKYLHRLGRYIERNPLEANMDGIDCPSDYRWSSAAAYALGKTDALVDTAMHPYWSKRGETDEERMENYRRFLSKKDPEEADIFNDFNGVVGDDDFKRTVRSRFGRKTPRCVGRPRKKQ